MAKGWGIFKPVGDDDPGPAKDDVELAKNLGKISKLGGINDPAERKEKALGLLGEVNKIVERGKARQARNEEDRKRK